MLRQQLDRRFVLGITMSFKNITLWIFDRSGALGVAEPCNFHEVSPSLKARNYEVNLPSQNPDVFIRAIAAISLLPSHRLGWDLTMKLFNHQSEQFQFSHTIRASRSLGVENIVNSEWLLTLVNNGGTATTAGNGSEQKIILHKAMLLRMAEGMNGRAVQVHLGYLAQDRNIWNRVSNSVFLKKYLSFCLNSVDSDPLQLNPVGNQYPRSEELRLSKHIIMT